MASSYDCDVLVAGGGPAGSAAATFLARAGRRGVLLERDQFSRFHSGESLLASVNDVLRAIGADELVRGAGFTQKWGATFLPADGSFERYLDFGSAPGVDIPQTWQVPRAAFDELLLRHAAACGADVREQQRIVDIAFDADGVTATVQKTNSTCGARTLRAGAMSTLRVEARCSDASSTCGSTSRGWQTSPSSRTTRACRGRTAVAPATSGSSRATISAGSG